MLDMNWNITIWHPVIQATLLSKDLTTDRKKIEILYHSFAFNGVLELYGKLDPYQFIKHNGAKQLYLIIKSQVLKYLSYSILLLMASSKLSSKFTLRTMFYEAKDVM